MDNFHELYTSFVKTHSEVDYSNKNSVKKGNKAVTKMLTLIATSKKSDPVKTQTYLEELLNHKECEVWSATHLLENFPNSGKQKEALTIIETIASGDSAEAMGFQFWLKDWKSKNVL